jgi:hypothetical protein
VPGGGCSASISHFTHSPRIPPPPLPTPPRRDPGPLISLHNFAPPLSSPFPSLTTPLLLGLYPLAATAVLRALACVKYPGTYDHPGGLHIVAAQPLMPCLGSDHGPVLGLAVAAAALHLALFPLATLAYLGASQAKWGAGGEGRGALPMGATALQGRGRGGGCTAHGRYSRAREREGSLGRGGTAHGRYSLAREREGRGALPMGAVALQGKGRGAWGRGALPMGATALQGREGGRGRGGEGRGGEGRAHTGVVSTCVALVTCRAMPPVFRTKHGDLRGSC